MRVLLTGWPSFIHGEATAGDVLSLRWISSTLERHDIPHDTAWSPRFRPGALDLRRADPRAYTHVIFACGPARGWQIRALHQRYARCRRIAVGVSVIDPHDPAVTGFHLVLPRDNDSGARPDLSGYAATTAAPVVGVALANPQPEYGSRQRGDSAHAALREWLCGLDCARLPLDTRLDPRDWSHCSTADQFMSILSRLDAVISTRLHGLALGLASRIPVLAVDPVSGGGKVSAQAAALDWPALVTHEDVTRRPQLMDRWWNWCLSPTGRVRAAVGGETWNSSAPKELIDALLTELN